VTQYIAMQKNACIVDGDNVSWIIYPNENSCEKIQVYRVLVSVLH